jgi:ribosomal protein S6
MVYETSFLFLPNLASDELAAQVGKLKEVITSNGGEVVAEEYPQMISLSYPIRHRMDNKYTDYATAYFGWVKYEIEADKAEEIKKAIDAIKSMLRYLTTKTVKENTIVSKDVFGILQGKEPMQAKPKEVKRVKPQEEGEMNEEEVDEELDKMLDDSAEEEAEENTEEKESAE